MIVTAVGSSTGHFLPALALASELHSRGHEVLVGTIERWRDRVEECGMRFHPIEEPEGFAGPRPDSAWVARLAEAARSFIPPVREFRPDLVVGEVFALPQALAAEGAGTRRATLFPDSYAVPEPGTPVGGFLPPRTVLGRAVWGATWPLAKWAWGRGRQTLNEVREELGLAPEQRFDAPISEELAMVATFPQLEFPRSWPPHVHVTGPMLYGLPHPDVELPLGEDPLVLVVPSTTELDSPHTFLETTLDALAEEPVRIVATMSRSGQQWDRRLPVNAVVVDWLSYDQVMPRASLVVCNGGHGTIARALAEGVPVLVSPMGGNTAGNGARVVWSGAGLMLPRRFLAPAPVRRAVRRLLADARFATRAREFAAWARENDGAARASELVEGYVPR